MSNKPNLKVATKAAVKQLEVDQEKIKAEYKRIEQIDQQLNAKAKAVQDLEVRERRRQVEQAVDFAVRLREHNCPACAPEFIIADAKQILSEIDAISAKKEEEQNDPHE